MNKCVFNVDNECSALMEKCCKGCHFRKTRAELLEGREKAKKRVDALPEKLKQYILRKYYSQRKPSRIPKG